MEPIINAPVIANLLGTVQGIFFAIVLLTIKRGNVRGNKFFAAFLAAVAINSFDDVLYRSRYILSVPQYTGVGASMILLIGPFFYYYVKAWTNPRLRLQWRDAVHLLPFLVLFLRVITWPAEHKLVHVQEMLTGDWHGISLYPVFAMVQVLSYLIGSFVKLASYQKRMRDFVSLAERLNLRWVRRVLAMVSVLWISLVVTLFFNVALMDSVNPYLSPVFIYVLGFMAVRQQKYRLQERVDIVESSSPGRDDGPQLKYLKSGLSADRKKEYLQRVTVAMKVGKPYRNSDLTLPELAEQLSMSPNHLSQTINEDAGQNFFDFVNHYRVEDVKEALADASRSHLTIFGIALEAGFNSKTAFNVAFKKHTGMTPSVYKKSLSATPFTKTA